MGCKPVPRSALSGEHSSANRTSGNLMAETQLDFHLEIAHVLFIDIVGYSRLLINEQAEVLQQLNQIVRNTSQFRKAEASGELIRLPTGDGMILVFLHSAEAPVQCAIEISDGLRSYPKSGYEWESTVDRSIRLPTSTTNQTWLAQALTSRSE